MRRTKRRRYGSRAVDTIGESIICVHVREYQALRHIVSSFGITGTATRLGELMSCRWRIQACERIRDGVRSNKSSRGAVGQPFSRRVEDRSWS